LSVNRKAPESAEMLTYDDDWPAELGQILWCHVPGHRAYTCGRIVDRWCDLQCDY